MQPIDSTIAPETLIHHRYLVKHIVGRGGMGAVYEAIDQRLGNVVALKQMLVSGAALASAFEREARILASLRHTGLPRVTDFFSVTEGQFLVMEYIAGNDLATLLQNRGRPFPLEEVVHWADQALDILGFLHGQQPPIIHRDIKPQNMKLTSTGTIVLLDFGLAKGYAAGGATTTGSLFGYTPNYAPLEQVQGVGTTPASDLYALAATLYHLLIGEPPPDVLSRLSRLAAGQPDPLRPAHELNPLLPAAVGAWLLEGLQLEQSRRPASAAAMRAGLAQIQRGAPRPVAPPSTTTTTVIRAAEPAPPTTPVRSTAPAIERRRSGPLIALVSGLLALVLVLSGALIAVYSRGPVLAPTAGIDAQLSAPAPATLAPSASPVTQESAIAAPTAAEGQPAAAAVQQAAPIDVAPENPSAAPIAAQPQDGPRFGISGPQRPLGLSASGTAPSGRDSSGALISYDVANIDDGRFETAWRVPGNGIGQYVELTFVGPIRVRAVQLIPGYAKIDPTDSTNRFIQNRRVTRVRFEFSDGRSIEASFDPENPELQNATLPDPVVSSSLRIVILATTPPGSVEGRDFTPLSEVVVIGEPQVAP